MNIQIVYNMIFSWTSIAVLMIAAVILNTSDLFTTIILYGNGHDLKNKYYTYFIETSPILFISYKLLLSYAYLPVVAFAYSLTPILSIIYWFLAVFAMLLCQVLKIQKVLGGK